MKNIWTIARREYRSFFESLVAYILLITFLGITGFFTWLISRGNVFFINEASLQVYFSVAFWTVFFFIPALTMRMIAEERRTGTLEALLARAVSDWQVIVGKYTACLLLILTAIAFTLPYYFTVSWLGNVDHGAVWCGYLGLVLLSSLYIAIGLFASSITDNQIVAFMLALLISLFFHWIFDFLVDLMPSVIGETINFLSASTHFTSISRGVIDSRDVIYFVSFTLLGLILAEAQLAKRNIID